MTTEAMLSYTFCSRLDTSAVSHHLVGSHFLGLGCRRLLSTDILERGTSQSRGHRRRLMKSTKLLIIVMGALGASAAFCQAPPAAAQKSGPGVQAPQDPKQPELLKTCKVPPPPGRGGGQAKGGGPAKGGQAKGPAPAAGPQAVTIMGIAGVIAPGQQWKEVWQVDGNNADGIIATKDGGILIAQNDNSNVVKLDKNGKTSIAYTGLKTGGSGALKLT